MFDLILTPDWCKGTLFLPHHPFSDPWTLTLGHKSQCLITVFRLLHYSYRICYYLCYYLITKHLANTNMSCGKVKEASAINCAVFHSQLCDAIYCLYSAWVRVFKKIYLYGSSSTALQSIRRHEIEWNDEKQKLASKSKSKISSTLPSCMTFILPLKDLFMIKVLLCGLFWYECFAISPTKHHGS